MPSLWDLCHYIVIISSKASFVMSQYWQWLSWLPDLATNSKTLAISVVDIALLRDGLGNHALSNPNISVSLTEAIHVAELPLQAAQTLLSGIGMVRLAQCQVELLANLLLLPRLRQTLRNRARQRQITNQILPT